MKKSTSSISSSIYAFRSQSNFKITFPSLYTTTSNKKLAKDNNPKRKLKISAPKKINTSYSRASLSNIYQLSTLSLPKPFVPTHDYEISLRILSNYGDPENVSLSEIDILESNGIPVKEVAIYMETAQKNKRLELLHNNHIIKSAKEEMWSEPWELDKSPLTLKIKFKTFTSPESIRLFNSRIGGKSNVKDFEIYDETLIYKGTVPDDFGIIAPLINCNVKEFLPQECVTLENKIQRMHDSFGDLPVPEVKIVDIKLLSSIDDDQYIGLNSIELFNEKGSPIPYKSFDSIEVINGYSMVDNTNLLKLKKRDINDSAMWSAKRANQNPVTLRIKLDKPYRVSAIRIWNYNGRKKSIGTKAASISINTKINVWSGRLKPGNGTMSNIEASVTDIWLIDSHIFTDDNAVNFLVTSREE